MKHFLLCSLPSEFNSYIKEEYRNVFEEESVKKFREFAIDEIFSGLNFSFENYYGKDLSQCRIL